MSVRVCDGSAEWRTNKENEPVRGGWARRPSVASRSKSSDSAMASHINKCNKIMDAGSSDHPTDVQLLREPDNGRKGQSPAASSVRSLSLSRTPLEVQ